MADFTRDNKTYSSPYANLPGYQDAFNKLVEQAGGLKSDSDQTRLDILKRLNSVTDQFKNIFNNNVGRAATDEDLGKFLQEQGGDVVANSPGGRSETNPTDVRNQIAQYVGDTFQQAAQDTAQSKLTDLSSTAGSLADQYLSMGKASLASLADDLTDYQTRLFDKLRPQLNLSAQAGGFQDSGGQTLQEQGAFKDLGTSAMGYMIPLQNQVQTTADAIRYGGAAAPYSLASSFAAGQPGALAATGAGALGSNVNAYMANLNNMAAMARLQFQGGVQSNLQPSFGSNLGQSFGTQLGGNLADMTSGGLQGGLSKLATLAGLG